MRSEFSPDAPQANDPPGAPAPGSRPARPTSTHAPAEAPFSWPTLALVRSLPVAVAEEWMHDGLIAAAARLVAEDAHRCELSFERVLVALKREWSRLPEARLLQITDGRDLLDRLVTESIKAYYALPVGPTGTEARAAPAGGTRERSVVVARTLLEVIHTHLPEMRGTDGVPRSDREPPCDDPSAVELEDRLMRALGSLPPDDVTALVDGLHHLHAALRAHRWPRATGRGTHGVPFHPPQH